MQTAHIYLDADRSARVVMGGQSNQYPDLGAAMAKIAAIAREGNQHVTAHLHDGNTLRTLTFDNAGRLTQSQDSPLTPADPPHPGPDENPPEVRTAHAEAVSSAAPLPSTPDARASKGPNEIWALEENDHSAGNQAVTNGDGSYPMGNRFSGPAPPLGVAKGRRAQRKQKRDQVHRSAGSGRKSLRKKVSKSFSVPGIVLAILLVAVIIAYFVPNIIGSPSDSSPENIPNSQTSVQSGGVRLQDATTPVPGFAQQPGWEYEVPQTASVTATDRGVLVVDGNSLTVLNPRTGEERFSTAISGGLEFAVDTVVEGQAALVWRVGDTAWALPDGLTDAREYELPKDARISSAGQSVIIKTGNQLQTLGREGLRTLPTPEPGSTPMALDNDVLISAGFSGPITRTNIATGETSTVELEKPAEDLNVIRWVSAGYGKIVTLWGEAGASTSSGHRIQLVVSNAQTGKISSTVETTTDVVGEANWVRGQGYQLALIGPYLFSMGDGLLAKDGSKDGLQFGEPRGQFTPTVVDNEQTLLEGDVAWKTTTDVLAVLGDKSFAVVRSDPTRVVGYPSDS